MAAGEIIDDSAMIGTLAELVIGADRLGEFEAIHVRHFDIGQDRVELVARAQHDKPSFALVATETR